MEQLYATLILSCQPSLIGSTMCGRLLKVVMINASNNIGQGSNQEEISEIRRQGVKVENEEFLPENLPISENENQIPGVHGEWVTPTTCPRRGIRTSVMQRGGRKITVGVRLLKCRSSICSGCASHIIISGRLSSR